MTGPEVVPGALSLAADLLGGVDARRDPAGWVRERLGEHLWSKQAEVMLAVRDHRRVAVRSAHATGKSHLASRLVCWWLDSHPPGSAFVVSTAPTFAQVRSILWRYVRQAHTKGRLPGELNQTEWFMGGELVAFGRKPADDDPSAFQGIHAEHVLIVVDEAGGVPEALWIAAEALATNDTSRILAIGNPDDPQSHFAKVCASPLWHALRISAEDTPAFTGEVVPAELLRLLVSPQWAADRAADWGTDSALYRSKVLGEFPSDDPVSVVRLTDVIRCRLDQGIPRSPAELLPVVLGVDVGGGGDETVIRERRGMVAGREWRNRHDRPERVTESIIEAIQESNATTVVVDSIGIGWGVVGDLRRLGALGRHKAAVLPLNVAEAARDSGRFENRRAELWWQVGRVLSEQRGWDLSTMANADTTVAQLVEPRWSISPSGRIRVEPKDDIRKRLGRSPDNADALLLAFAGGLTSGFNAQAFLDELVELTQGRVAG